jgi:hypothetical protein
MQRRRPGIVVGLMFGALIAFPLGLMLGRDGGDEPAAPAANPAPGSREPLRNPYSPDIYRDPAFIAEQQENLAALERACEARGELCDEAEAFRRALAGE